MDEVENIITSNKLTTQQKIEALEAHFREREIMARIEEIELNMTVESERLNKKRIAELKQTLGER
jgi:hypothetical protein